MKALLFFVLLAGTPARAATGDFLGELFAPGYNTSARVRAEERVYAREHAAGREFGLAQTRFDSSFPIFADGESSWRGSLFADYDAIDSGAQFPNGRLLPNRLWDPGVGLSHTRRLEDGRTTGGSLTVSSPSDRPFGSARELGVNAHFTYKLPQSDGNAWVLYLSVSNTRGFLPWLPLPGAAYFFQKGRKLQGLAGVPFLFLRWQPAELWTVTTFYLPIRTGEIKVAFGSPRGVQPYLLASYRTRNYLLAGRSDTQERFFFEEGTAQAGISFPLAKTLDLDLTGGQSFGRRFFLASRVTDRGSAPTIRPDNALFGSLRAQALF